MQLLPFLCKFLCTFDSDVPAYFFLIPMWEITHIKLQVQHFCISYVIKILLYCNYSFNCYHLNPNVTWRHCFLCCNFAFLRCISIAENTVPEGYLVNNDIAKKTFKHETKDNAFKVKATINFPMRNSFAVSSVWFLLYAFISFYPICSLWFRFIDRNSILI